MTSKEVEARSGVPRANIRYYEAEGLLAPARSGNGYRNYSEEDLRTLEKIKLLRRLGVTIEALRALRDGRAELSAVLDRRLAEFAENYNRQAEYLDFGGRAYLDEDGQWQEKPEDGSQIISLEDLMDVNPWDDAKAFHYTVEDDHVTAVTMSGTFQNTTAMWVETPDSYVPQIVTALVWGRREAPFWSLSRQAQLREQEEADWERGFTLHQPGVVITAEVEQTGFYYFQGMGWQPVEEGNRLSFTYTVALDNG